MSQPDDDIPKTDDGSKADNHLADSEKPNRHPRHTIASLRLNVAEAEKDRHWLLLPAEITRSDDGWKTYPLPTALDECFRISLIQCNSQIQTNPSACYIKRARIRYKERLRKRHFGQQRVEEQTHATRQAAYRFREAVQKESDGLKAQIDGVKAKVAEAIASLTDLYGLAKTGNSMIMRGFVDNRPVNGENVTIGDFQRSSQSILNHTAKIGLPTGDDKPAEDAIFAEYEASVKATQDGIEATDKPGDQEKVH
jgi:hypothetical protein